MEYALCLFFVKSTAYIFLFWLPKYLKEANGFGPTLSADISAIFDVGGILGGIMAGLITDRVHCSALICGIMIALGMPAVSSVKESLTVCHCMSLMSAYEYSVILCSLSFQLYIYYLFGTSSIAACACKFDRLFLSSIHSSSNIL